MAKGALWLIFIVGGLSSFFVELTVLTKLLIFSAGGLLAICETIEKIKEKKLEKK